MKSLDDKTLDQVFDRKTLMTIYALSNLGIVKKMGGPISTGKEANVFDAEGEQGKVALKVYLVENSNYKKMADYLLGDQRFAHMRRDRQSIIYAFCQKEFRNLQRAHTAGVTCPRPLACKNNVLVMELIADETGAPAKTLKKAGTDKPAEFYKSILTDMKKLFQGASLIHSDLSEYNILAAEKPTLIDFSHALHKTHPNWDEFLRRDIKNINAYFIRQKVETKSPGKIFEDISGD